MFGSLVKWLITVLAVLVAGTVMGLIITIVIAEVPLAVLVVAAMACAVVLFRLAVWAIKGSNYS